MTSSRRTNEPSGLEAEGSTAGASEDRDLEEWEAALFEKWQARAIALEEALNAIPGVSATVEVAISMKVKAKGSRDVISAH